MDVPMSLIMCARCGQPFAISQDKEERLRKCHNIFYCPDGHTQNFVGKTDEERLREQVRFLEEEKTILKEKLEEKSKKSKKKAKKK